MRSLSPGFCLAKCQTCFGYNVSNANYNLNEVSYSQKLAHPVCFAKGVSARLVSTAHKRKRRTLSSSFRVWWSADKHNRTLIYVRLSYHIFTQFSISILYHFFKELIWGTMSCFFRLNMSGGGRNKKLFIFCFVLLAFSQSFETLLLLP